MSYALGATSRARLIGVHPQLVACVEAAILASGQDFIVNEGLRSVADQLKAFNAGNSKLKFGKHQPQPVDGLGHAVDLVPWVDGRAQWLWGGPGDRNAAGYQVGGCYAIAAAMRAAAVHAGVRLRWGGVWDRTLNDLGPGVADMAAEVHAYCARHPGPDFLDGPHFELAS